ncbi:integrase [Ferrovum myxofaciens]|uniref:Tyrosine-type recombinase/integrase n=1 Tax=Ferrovum myxofaciens TaxID=416213 RepID=A0A9E6MZK8_9PROT|nr:tyrosine-type recombinase/integrase [Ferrovum myxofaciens]QKE37567.1 MAG: tyrosine-type recombinase/integrase [Ferrovum myxofaciens]QWY75221.1 MAG: tyrosine-type recombinase/integrase [Ferrovum myxofaciens]QWY77955.1 MAG: tyrosine-type recombinase/integrase [Ferrovum myxofaciens]
MATFTKRGTSWRAQIVKKIAGETVRLSQSFNSKAQAVAWATETEAGLLGQKIAGLTGRPDRRKSALPNTKEVVGRYLAGVSVGNRGGRWEVIRLNKIMKEHPWLAEKEVALVTPEDIGRFRDERLLHVSNASVLRELGLLGAVFQNALTEWRLVGSNPVRGIRKPPPSPHRETRIPPADEVVFMKAFKMDPLVRPTTYRQQVGLIFALALETAMRSGEVVGLTWDRVNLEKRYLSLEYTKNGSHRDVPLSARAVMLLELAKGLDGERVFTVSDQVRDVLFRRYRPENLSYIHFHDTRHEAVFRLSKKLQVMDLARMTGHRDTKMLMAYYNPTASEIAELL